MANFDDEFDKAPEASFDDEFEAAPAVQTDMEALASADKGDSEFTTGLKAAGAGAATKAAQMTAAEYLPGMAEKAAFYSLGGTATKAGNEIDLESIGKQFDPNMVNVTPSSVGRMALDEGILGIGGLAGRDSQLEKLRKESDIRANDKTNFLKQIDSPTAINKADLLEEYRKLINPDALDMSSAGNRKLAAGFKQDVGLKNRPFETPISFDPNTGAVVPGEVQNKITTNFDGAVSVLENEKTKAELQDVSKYGKDTTETARQALDKARAEVNRKASEKYVLDKLGPEGANEFQNIKQRAGNASVAESIISQAKGNTKPVDGILQGTDDLVGRLVRSKGAGFGAVAMDGLGKLANSPAGKMAPFAATAYALANGDAQAAVEELPGDLMGPAGMAYEAIRPTAAGDLQGEREMKVEQQAFSNYTQSPAAKDAKKGVLSFVSSDPQALTMLAQRLESEGSSYAAPLMKASQADERGKTAILYGLFQQPAFRKLLGDDETKTLAIDIPGVKKNDA